MNTENSKIYLSEFCGPQYTVWVFINEKREYPILYYCPLEDISKRTKIGEFDIGSDGVKKLCSTGVYINNDLRLELKKES